MDAAGPPNRVGRSAAEDLSGRVFWSEAGARSRCAGVPRAKSRGVAQRRGKNSAAMVSCGPAASIGPTPKQGFGPSAAPQRTSTCRIHCKRGGGLVQGAVPVGAPAFTAGSGSRMPDLDAATDAVSYPPHVMGKLACARDAKRCVLRRGAAIRYFDSAPLAFACASSERI